MIYVTIFIDPHHNGLPKGRKHGNITMGSTNIFESKYIFTDSCSISTTRLHSCKTMATIQPMTAINNKYPATILCCNNNFILQFAFPNTEYYYFNSSFLINFISPFEVCFRSFVCLSCYITLYVPQKDRQKKCLKTIRCLRL